MGGVAWRATAQEDIWITMYTCTMDDISRLALSYRELVITLWYYSTMGGVCNMRWVNDNVRVGGGILIISSLDFEFAFPYLHALNVPEDLQ